MSKGKSASAAARELKTTVRTMSKVKHDGVNIIKKGQGSVEGSILTYLHSSSCSLRNHDGIQWKHTW